MADRSRTYVCRSAVSLVETTFLWHSFSFLFRFLMALGNVVSLSTTGKYRKIRNSSGKYNLVSDDALEQLRLGLTTVLLYRWFLQDTNLFALILGNIDSVLETSNIYQKVFHHYPLVVKR